MSSKPEWKMKWKSWLKELGWLYVGQCSTCGGAKHSFKRGNDTLTAYPGRDFYEFYENKIKKTGRLSNLPSVIEAAKTTAP